MQSTNATARHSAISHQLQQVPVLRPHMLSREASFVGALSLAADLPHRAQLVVTELEKYQKSYRLDRTLSDILRRAKATVNRSANRRSFH